MLCLSPAVKADDSIFEKLIERILGFSAVEIWSMYIYWLQVFVLQLYLKTLLVGNLTTKFRV